MTDLKQQYQQLLNKMRSLELKYQRTPGAVSLVAVSKSQSTESISSLYQLSQQSFGENYLQEALDKISALKNKNVIWHFIGALQSNKLCDIARNFSWVQSVCRYKEAQMLSMYRMPSQPPLNICIQINLAREPTKTGISLEEAPDFIHKLLELPRLAVRGLMCLPPFTEDFDIQCKYFSLMRKLFEKLQESVGLDTLSMGTTHDFEAAIAQGATQIRIGTGLFGRRK